MTVIDFKKMVKNNKLNLSGMNLTEIPVKELIPLKISHLDLSNNKITSTNNVFSLLPGLVKLDLSNNNIKSVAGDIGALQKLTYLSLANNKIKDLPKGFSKLKQLKHLNVSNNPLKSVIDFKKMVKNNKLNLSGMNLTEIPVKELIPLKISHLDLSNNKITSTNNVFSLLPGLVKLDLSNNNIKSVAGDIGALQKLTYLSLANNKIKDLPKGFSKLKQLKHLNVSNNPLKSELAEAVGPSQNNAQCQTAATNAVQYLKGGDSKKQGDKNKKDKKNSKASPLQNDESKNKSEPKKKPAGSVSRVFGFIGMLISYTLLLAVVIGLFVYALSYYDKRSYGNIKAKILPIWASATSNLDPQVASKVNFYLLQAGNSFDLAVQTSIEASIKSYKWVKANPTVEQYAKNVQDTWKSLWDSVFKKVKST